MPAERVVPSVDVPGYAWIAAEPLVDFLSHLIVASNNLRLYRHTADRRTYRRVEVEACLLKLSYRLSPSLIDALWRNRRDVNELVPADFCGIKDRCYLSVYKCVVSRPDWLGGNDRDVEL